MRSATINLAACALALTAGSTAIRAQDAPNQTQPAAVAAGIAPEQPQPGQTNQSSITAAQVAAGIAPVAAQNGQPGQVAGVTGGIITTDGKVVYQIQGQPGKATGLSSYRRLADLARPIDIHLKDATVEEAVKALSRASGITIGVADGMPRDLRLTVEAQHVPLKTVLEGIANQGDLKIGREGETIVLSPWPSLNVNGARSFYKGQYAPWGDEWGGRPTVTDLVRAGYMSPSTAGQTSSGLGIGRGQGRAGSRAPSGGGVATDSGTFYGLTGAPAAPSASLRSDGSVVYDSGQPAFASSSYSLSGGMFNMTALGDKLVIAERGVGPQGESAVILTVYQWDSSRQALRRISSTIHSADGASRRSSTYRNAAPGSRAGEQGGNSPFRQNGAPAAPGSFFGGSGAGAPPAGTIYDGKGGGATAPGAPGSYNSPVPAPGDDEAPEPVLIKPGTFNMPDPDDAGEPL